MRTTLNIPEDLLDEAKDLLGFQSKSDTIIIALKELIRSKRIEELKSLYGKIDINIDINKSRRRTKDA
jgi:metal-responsive CopG/Arc/MetJ family transcriptional regulator